MPLDIATGKLIPYTDAEIAAMNIRTFDVRNGGHPVHTREVDQNTMSRTFLVDWNAKERFVSLVMGDSVIWTDTRGPSPVKKLSRQLPHALYGRHPGSGVDLVATKIDEMRGHGVGRDDTLGMPQYEDAEIRVFYEQPTYRLEDDAQSAGDEVRRFISPPNSTQGELETYGPLSGGTFQYTTPLGAPPAGVQIPYGVSTVKPIERFAVTWHNCPWELYNETGAVFGRAKLGDKIPGPNTPDGIPYEGTVNSQDMFLTGIRRNYPAGTLLLERVEAILHRRQQCYVGIGGLMYDFVFHWAYRPQGWLNLPLWNPRNPAQSGHYAVSVDGTFYNPGALPDYTGLFNCRDHNYLFDPDY
jgi:hypothetical protein